MEFTHRAGFDSRPTGRRGPVVIHILLASCIVVAAALVLCTAVAPARAAVPAGPTGYAPGTIVVSQAQRRLFLIGEDGGAISYPVAVGRFGKQWRGTAVVDGKYRNPAWAPPAEVKRAEPWLPDYIPGGSSRNPMGMRALTLSGGEYAIHGTNRPDSIGTAASFGCIRMFNRDIVDLYERVDVGTPVVVMP
ncbi:L,D-transpeptidase [Lichenibacterium minor]|jgi:lipoprotein-anchoring transpeptidase ErfK/SrfK|uniref:L,D-transpeptidase n=1 Tax=Lichenibacterium minor TaxID=2316528 RepID=A0A4Q2U4Q2_9HYPH|nr:L,D-transpeptidase [Lichenibacterium minor]RYC29897.1 L,D-transpeptidase [Lichenibacterium minor]